MLWTVHGVFLPAWAFDYSEQMHLLVGRASGPVKITDLSLQAYLPLSLLALVTDLFSAVWGFAPLMLDLSHTAAHP